MTEMVVTTTEAPKRKPGRPKGTPRTGGRQPGTPNRKNQITRDYVISRGAPVEFLCSVAQGRRFTVAAQLGDSKRVVDLDPEVADCTFHLGMAQ